MSKFTLTAQLRLQAPTNTAQVVGQIKQQLQGITATVNIAVPPQIKTQLATVQKSLNQTKKVAKEAATGITGFGEAAALAGKRFLAFTIAGGAIVRFAGIMKDAAKDAIDFERQMNRIAQATGLSAKSIGAISDEISRLGTTFGVSSQELAKAALVLAQAGLTAKDTTRSLETLAKTDLAPTFENITDTTEAMVAVMQQFNLTANEMDKTFSSINAVAAKFAVESGDITTAIRRTGGAFQAAGGSLNELLALFTSVRQTTRESAESIATGFRTIFTRLQRVRTQNFLKTLGIDLQDIKGQFVGPYEAVRRLSMALKQLQGTDPRFAQIIEELGGYRQISKVIPLIQQFEVSQKALNVAVAGSSSLTEDAARAQETLAVQIQKVKEQFYAMIRTMVGSGTFKAMATGALKLAEALIKVASALTPVLPLLATLATFKLGQSIIPFFKGFSSKGGFGFGKMAKGGLVPGVGSRDTVPAMLTPGEYVLRKDTTRKLGLHRGGPVQFFNGGSPGGVKRSTGSQSTKLGKDVTLQEYQGDRFGVIALNNSYNKKQKGGIFERSILNVPTKAYGTINAPLTVAGFSSNFASKFENYTAKNLVKLANNLGVNVAKNLQAQQAYQIGPATLSNYASMVGGLFESAIGSLGIPFSADQANIDFIGGLRGATDKWTGGAELTGIPVDAKRTWDRRARRDMIGKISRYYNTQKPKTDQAAISALMQGTQKTSLNTDLLKALQPGATITGSNFAQFGIIKNMWGTNKEKVVDELNKAVGPDAFGLVPIPGRAKGQMIQRKEFGLGGMVPKSAASMMERNLGDIRRARRRRMTEEGKLDPQATYLAKNRQKRFAQNMGAQKQRTIGYLDGDVLGNPAYATTVQAEIAKAGVTGGVAGYHNYLIELAGQKRKLGSLKKFSAVFGVPGSGKTSLAMKSSADKATLRRTKRIPILRPSDIDKVDEVIETVASTSKALRELEPGGLFTGVDKFTILSSSTKEEQAEVIKRRKLRDRQIAAGISKTGFGRKPGVTTGAEIDTGAVEALAMANLGPERTRVLGIRPGFKLARKKGEQIPELETKKIGLLYGALSPSTLGHADNLRLAQEAGIDPKDFVVAVSKIGGTAKKGDEHSQRTAIYSQGFRAALAQASFPGATVYKAGAQDFLSTAPTIFERQTGGGRRKFVKAGPGSIAFAGDDKGEKELEKYTKAGYSTMVGARNEISGTAARKAILEGNIAEMQKMLSPEAIKVIQANQGRIQARTEILPKLFERVETKVGKQAETINQQLAQYPSTITGKIRTEQPEVAAKVEALRKQRDAVKRLREKMPVKMLNTLARMFPQKYGFLVQGFAKGGKVDSVPAMLTPGEYVINKDVASKIGVANLDKLNKGKIPGFAGGGSVGGMMGGLSGVASIGFAMSAVSGLVSSFEGLSDSVKNTMNSLTMVATQFGIMHMAMQASGEKFQKYNQDIEDASKQLEYFEPAIRESQQKLTAREGITTKLTTQKARQDAAVVATNMKLQRLQGRRANVQAAAPGTQYTGSNGQSIDRDTMLQTLDTRIGTTQSRKNQILTARKKTNLELKNSRLIQSSIDQDITALTEGADFQKAKKAQTQKRQARAAKIGMGFALVGAAAQVGGGLAEEEGRRRIEAGTGGENLFTYGKAAKTAGSWAGMGAAAGAAFGPLGMAIGGVVGGLAGFIKGLKDAEKELANIKMMKEFNASIEKTGRMLADLSTGATKFSDVKTQTVGQAQQFNRIMSQNVTSKETRQDVLAGAKGQLDNFYTYLNKAAEEVNTFDDFIKKAGPEVFYLVSDLSNIPSNELRQQFEKTIESNIKHRKSLETVTKIQDEYGNRVRNLIRMGQAFETVSMSMQGFDTTINTLMGFIEGNVGGGQLQDQSALLADPTKFFNPEKFTAVLNRDIRDNLLLATTFPGQDKQLGESLATDVESAQQAMKDLPNILLDMRNNFDAFDTENLVQKFASNFDKSAPFVRKAMEQAANNLIGAEGKESGFLDKIKADLMGTANELGASFKPIFETAALISSKMTEEANRRTAFMDKIVGVMQKEIELRNKGLDIQAQAEELRAKAENRPVNLDLLQGLDFKKQLNILGKDAALANNPMAIGTALREAENELLAKQTQLQKEGVDRFGILNKEIANQQTRIANLNNALEFLADIGNRTAVTMQKLERAQAKAQFKQGIAEKVTFAETPKELRDMGNQMAATRVAAQTGDIKNVIPNMRGEVLDMLNQLGDVSLGVLGGKSGKQVKEGLVAKQLRDLGFSKEDAENIAKAQSSETEKLRAELANLSKIATDANLAQVQSVKDNTQRLIDAYDRSVQGFTKAIKDIFDKQKEEQVKKEISDLESQTKATRIKKGDLKYAASRFGGEEGAKLMKGNLELARTVGQQQKNFNKFDKLSRLNTAGAKAFAEEAIGYNVEYGMSRTTHTTRFGGGSDVKRADFEKSVLETADKLKAYAGGDEAAASIFKDQVRKLQAQGGFEGDTIHGSKAEDIIQKAFENTQTELRKTFADLETNKAQLSANLGVNDPVELARMTEDVANNFAFWQNVMNSFNQSDSIAKFTNDIAKLQEQLSGKKAELAQIGQPTSAEVVTTAKDMYGGASKLASSVYGGVKTAASAVGGTVSDLAGRAVSAIGEVDTGNLYDTLLGTFTGRNARGVVQRKSNPFRKATGGLINGSGSGDRVPALLEPGEFVLNRNAVSAAGAGRLAQFNKKFGRFRKGGSVRMQGGGAIAGVDMSAMDRAVQNFGSYVDKFGSIADSMKGLEIQLRATHQVEVIINGAQVMVGLQDSIKNLVVAETNKAINQMLSQKFGLPPVDTAVG